MRILFAGDVMGRSGREAVEKHLPVLRQRLKIDVAIVNGENAAQGRGITGKICKQFYEWGVDCITTGNHAWSQRDILTYIDGDPRLLRPLNFIAGTPGRGLWEHMLPDGRKITVLHAIARYGMDLSDNPFAVVNELLTSRVRMGAKHSVFVDFHGEATSEKMAFGHYLDGRVSGVVGTHTHVPTADAQILPGGTAYQTDAGMCGDYDSVIGSKKEIPIQRFTRNLPTERFSPADGEGTFCGVFIETDDKTGLAQRIEPVRVGGRLREAIPDL